MLKEEIPIDWLDKKITVAEAEVTLSGKDDEDMSRFPKVAKPFGFMNGEWESLKAAMRPGDELWTFCSPADSWKHLAGRAGIALLRDGKTIRAIVTTMN